MALAVAKIECELREVLLADKPAEMLALSNKGTVPVLRVDEAQIIDESLEVMNWALRQNDPENWLDTDVKKTESLIKENDFEFKDKLDRYKYHVRYPEFPQQHYREQAEVFLSRLENCLDSNDGLGLISKKTSLADIAIFPFIRQLSGVDRVWFERSPYQKLKAWLAKLEKGSLFLSVMNKTKPWQKGDAPTYLIDSNSNN